MRFVRKVRKYPTWRLSGQDVSGKQTHLAGEYTLIGMMTGNKTLTQAQVEAAGLADNTVLRIGADGTGAYALNGEAERSLHWTKSTLRSISAAASPSLCAGGRISS